MKVGILRVGSSDWLGGTYYTKTIAQVVRDMGHDVCWVVTSASDVGNDTNDPVIRAPISSSIIRRGITRIGRHFGHPYPSLEFELRRNGIDVAIPLMFSLGAHARSGWVGWIPDFQHFEQPEHFTAAQVSIRDRGHRSLVSDSRVLALSSLHAANLAEERYPDSREKTVVLRFAASLDNGAWATGTQTVPIAYGIEEPFVYLPNQFWAHKNHRTVFQAWSLLGIRAPLLVCTGSLNDHRNPEYFDSVMAMFPAEVKSRVRILGIVPRQDQLALFRNAAIVLNPSRYEGWSTTVEEGLAFGKQLLLSELPVFKEQAGSSATYFPSTSVTELAEVVNRMASSLSLGIDHAAEARGRIHHSQRKALFMESLSKALKLAQAKR